MPSSGPRTCTNRVLRDYLLAALRCSAQPLTTTELRLGAPSVAAHGSARPLPPTQETIYRLLRSLQNEGIVLATGGGACRRAWTVAPNPTAEREIAALEALFGAPSAAAAHRPSTFDPCRRRR
ncbi:hypothetical protein FEG63_24660 [Mycolicibacterium sphagni]|uniref:Transcription regulator PadR N-terminal domain-containing protein n=1 Tax=Mycolicibacterium sphagni TaxID=1786 RepID=A0ABX2K967_9MYCO|nr:hypothetical protein [Mycolicibacterium sphagni]